MKHMTGKGRSTQKERKRERKKGIRAGRRNKKRKKEEIGKKQESKESRQKQPPECLKNYITRTENQGRVHEGQDRSG